MSLAQEAQALYCCATVNDDGEAAVLISNFNALTRLYELELLGLREQLPGEHYILDRERNLQREDLEWRELDRVSLLLPKHSVALLKFASTR